MVQKLINLKQTTFALFYFCKKNSEIVANPLCLRNISEDFSADNIKKIYIIWICL